MKHSLIVLTLTSSVSLGGCGFLMLAGAGAPSVQQQRIADYGNYPTNYEELAKEVVLKKLKRPQNVEFVSVSKPEKTWIGGPWKRTFGYSVYVKLWILPKTRENPHGQEVFIRNGKAKSSGGSIPLSEVIDGYYDTKDDQY
jgi:hypothetical protein